MGLAERAEPRAGNNGAFMAVIVFGESRYARPGVPIEKYVHAVEQAGVAHSMPVLIAGRGIQGLGGGGIGTADAARIFYRALTVYLTASSQFVDARLACVQAAEDLFGDGSNQQQRVREAFDLVGIQGETPTPPPLQARGHQRATYTDMLPKNVEQPSPTGLATYAVVGHNVEVVRSLQPSVRDLEADYGRSLSLLRQIKLFDQKMITKSSIMLGLVRSPRSEPRYRKR